MHCDSTVPEALEDCPFPQNLPVGVNTGLALYGAAGDNKESEVKNRPLSVVRAMSDAGAMRDSSTLYGDTHCDVGNK